MKKILAFVFIAFILTACKEDDQVIGFGFSEDITINGLKFSPESGTVWHRFYSCEDPVPNVSVDMLVDSHAAWLSARCDYQANNWLLYVTVSKNKSPVERRGFVNVSVGNKRVQISVVQCGDETVAFLNAPKRLSNAGGDFLLKFRTGGIPKVSLRFTEPWCSSLTYVPWCVVGEVRKIGHNTYEVPVSYEENTSFGRIAQLVVETKWAHGGQTIIQAPKLFGECETVRTDNLGGNLALMLGYMGKDVDYGIRNISRIRHLTIEGGINVYDLDVLKEYTDKILCPVTLDLGKAEFIRRANNPYEDFGYVPQKVESKLTIMADNHIPWNMFAHAHGLVGCVLPEKTISIGNRAFCFTKLSRIDIPSGVVNIGEYAFKNCADLTEIYIDKQSKLEELGESALSTGRYVKAIYLPKTLIRVSEKAFDGFKVNNLYVGATKPPDWKLSSKIDTLYLPYEELIDAYKSAPGWKNIPEIKVRPQGWEDTPWPPVSE